jgi:tRNA A37 threonylcarbamoyladenosine dehydratase
VFSIEQPQPACKEKLGSISYIPGIIGLTAAGIIINDILRGQETSLTNNPRKKY